VIFSVGTQTLKRGSPPIVNGLDREAMERRSGAIPAGNAKYENAIALQAQMGLAPGSPDCLPAALVPLSPP